MRRSSLLILAACLGVLAQAQPGTAQTSGMVVGTGYLATWPLWFFAAPGQVLAVTVHGIGLDLKEHVIPTERPLPRELAGISVEMQYGAAPGEVFAPLLGLIKVPSCGFSGAPSYCKSSIMIILQVPYELRVLRQEWLSSSHDCV